MLCITGCFLLNSFASRNGLSIRFVKGPEKYSVGGRSRKRFNSYKLGLPMNSLSTFLHRSCTTQTTKRCHTPPWAKTDRECPSNHDWTQGVQKRLFLAQNLEKSVDVRDLTVFCGKYCDQKQHSRSVHVGRVGVECGRCGIADVIYKTDLSNSSYKHLEGCPLPEGWKGRTREREIEVGDSADLD